MKKRILSLLLALALLLTALPQYLTPARAAVISSGSCGKNLTWTLDDAGTLTISGTGNMENYDNLFSNSAPWKESLDRILRIVVQEGVTSVGNCAFKTATKVTSAQLPESLTKLGECAFGACYDLKEVNIPQNITVIPKDAFDECWNLEHITLHDGITEIGQSAFGNTGLLELKLPQHLITIGDGAFSKTKMESVSIPESVKTIGYGVFTYCPNLVSATIPDSVEFLDGSVFSHCKNLVHVKLPQGLTELGDGLFAGCLSLEELEIPQSVTKIGSFAFDGCVRLWHIDLPSGLESIGSYAFKGCSWLLGIDLPAALRETGFCVFENCPKLMGAVVRSSNVEYNTFGAEAHLFNNPDNTSLYGIPGSTTQAYAERNGYSFYPIAEHQHSYFSTVLEPSCTLGGYQVQVCDCGHIQSATPLKALGHCYRNGRCIRCDKSVPAKFSDVKEGAYYYDPVMWAVDNGITSGAGDGVFSPKKVCTREQVVTFLWKAAGAPRPESSQNPFTDVKSGKYYYNAVLWAVENGITSGSSAAKFGVGKPCTREQVVSFLWKALGSPAPAGTESPFTDVKPGKYYFNPVLWAVENGITSGATPTTFGVGRSCTRAQIVTFLYKAYVG